MPPVIAWAVTSSVVVIALLVWGILLYYARRSALDSVARRRFAVVSGVYLFGWLVLTFVLAAQGVFRASATELSPGLAMGILLPLLTGAFLLYRSSTLNTVIAAVPLGWIVGIQFYRVVGLNFLVLHGLGLLPGEFAIPSGVGDVIIGLAAPVVGYLYYKGYRQSHLAVLSWNVFGILDLVIAVGTGFLTSPGPLQSLALQNPNVLIGAFPLVLVPVFAVPLSILLHLAALKRLNAVESDQSSKLYSLDRRNRNWRVDSHPLAGPYVSGRDKS